MAVARPSTGVVRHHSQRLCHSHPDWQVPDETAHYNYIRQFADSGRIPVIEQGDWQQDYQVMLTSCAFHPAVVSGDLSQADNIAFLDACGYNPEIAANGVESVQYEDHQPPLYYLVQTPVYLLTDGDMTGMRIFSAIIGSVAIVCAWAILRLLFPQQPWLALIAATVIAFLPQRLSIMAGISNDSLAEAMAGLVLLGTLIYLQQTTSNWRMLMGIGVLIGFTFLTKTTVYYVAGIAGLAVLWRWYTEKWPLKIGLQHIAALAIPALALGAIWWLHSIDVYGGTDFLGLQRHDEVVIGQPRTDDYIDAVYGGSTRVWLENMTRTTFQSFWGQFGWMAFPMQLRIYTALRIVCVGMLIGTGMFAFQQRWPRTLSASQRIYIGLLGLSALLVVGQFLFYNLSFVQFQGRYLYPALIPLALVAAIGIQGWVNWLVRIDKRLRWAGVVLALLMVLFAWYTLRDVISAIPNWS